MSRSNSDTSLSMKLPSNYFMQWLRENMSAGKINIDFHFDDKKRYLGDFLKDEIDNWCSEIPVVISAQTGAGKNHFIQNILLPKLIDENPDQNNLILILSNRIALSRQNKYKFAELLVEYKHNAKYITEINEYYTPKGIDNIYLNFDVVTVCSYHQLYERCVRPKRSKNDPNFVSSIDISRFKYIICDECHFFTSDASFNKDTEKILKKIISQGQNSIRIYMSATPEVVFEKILCEEFDIKQIQMEQQIQMIDKRINTIIHGLETYETLLGINEKNCNKNMRHEIFEKYDELSRLKEEKSAIENQFSLSLDFYYMARNYDYIIPHIYQENEELVELIKKSSDKWIIFSDSEGSRISKLLKDEVKYVFLSRKGIENEENKKRAYDYIIEKETINTKVLITTSVLDNGINITNSKLEKSSDKVLNIVIDSFDREQFIQMLGRIRVEESIPVQLYIREYTLKDIKSLLKKDAGYLVQMLYGNIQYCQYGNDEPSSYQLNECAVYKIISRMINMLTIIRNEEQDFFIKFKKPEKEAQKGFVYDFYKNGDGKNEIWSRNIVDLLESGSERVKRKKYIDEDIDNGESDVTRYESKLKDTFIRYIYQEMIPSYYELEIQNKYIYYIDSLSVQEKNRYEYLLSVAQNNHNNLSVVEKITILDKHFDFAAKNVFINMSFIKAMSDKITYYRDLADKLYIGNAIDEQLNWIEKSSKDLITKNIENISIEKSKEEDAEDIRTSYIVQKNEIDKFTKGRYVNDEFLQSRAILKGTNLEKSIAKKYFQKDSLKEALHQFCNIKGLKCKLESFCDNTNKHNTYYCFVRYNNGKVS